MTGRSPIGEFLARQVSLRRGDLMIAALSGAATTAATTLLLGLSGWFLAGAALAGAGGPIAVQAFNYLLPSAGLRGLAIARTAGRYGERLFGHRAAFRALAALRPALFAGLAAAPPQLALSLSSGEASARLVQDVGAIETVFVRRSAPWAAAAAAVAAVAVIALASLWAAVAYIAGLGLQIIVGRALADRLSRDPGRDRLRSSGRLKDGLAAYLLAAPELRCFESDAARDRSAHGPRRRTEPGQPRGARRRSAHGPGSGGRGRRYGCRGGGAGVAAALPVAALAVLATLAGLEGVTGLLRAAQQQGAYQEAVARLDAVLVAPTFCAATTAGPGGA